MHRGITVRPADKITSKHKVPNTSLTHLEEIHQQMDRIAKRQRLHQDHPRYHPTHITTAYIRDVHGPVTSNEKILLEQQWASYNLEHYYKQRWQTTTKTLSKMDWQTYSRNFTKSASNIQTYIIKMMTGWLPVYHHLNKMTPNKTKCPICGNDETISHIFTCEGRKLWRVKFSSQLRTQLTTMNTPANLQDKIINHLDQLLNDQQQQYHFKYYTIFAGLLPLRWTNHSQHQTTTGDLTIITSNNWSRKLSLWLTMQGHEAWQARNQQIHAKTTSKSPMTTFLNQKIHHLYQLQYEIGYHDRALFHQPIDDRLALTDKQKMTWIENTTNTMKVSMEDYAIKQKSGQRDIRQFFDKKQESQ